MGKEHCRMAVGWLVERNRKMTVLIPSFPIKLSSFFNLPKEIFNLKNDDQIYPEWMK